MQPSYNVTLKLNKIQPIKSRLRALDGCSSRVNRAILKPVYTLTAMTETVQPNLAIPPVQIIKTSRHYIISLFTILSMCFQLSSLSLEQKHLSNECKL